MNKISAIELYDAFRKDSEEASKMYRMKTITSVGLLQIYFKKEDFWGVSKGKTDYNQSFPSRVKHFIAI